MANNQTPSLPTAMAERIERWPLERLIPYARNARTHSAEQIAQLAASIREFGFNNPVLVDSRCGIIAGHGRLAAARKLGLSEVPVIVLDHLSETQKRAYMLADNRLALSAGWDEDLLNIELQALDDDGFDLDLVGFSDDELEQFRARSSSDQPAEEDAVPEPPQEPISRAGDLWILGGHRLLCGDSIQFEHVDRLMDGQTADLVFTDPPFNVDYQGYTEDRLTIQGDCMSAEAFREFLGAVCVSYRRIVKPTASIYICHPSSWQREFQDALEAASFEIRCQIIWAKNTFAWGFGRYKFQHEPIFYAHVAGETDAWYGDKSQSTLWEVNKPAANRLHPTMKPVELVERALVNSSRKNNVVVDLFGGSGSTLIACERLNRRARLMEIDPRYTDVIVQRWQGHTGRAAIHAASGVSFDDVANERIEVTGEEGEA